MKVRAHRNGSATGRLQRSLTRLLDQVRACQACAGKLPRPPRPIVRAAASARVLIVGQAPGLRAHESGIPWNDPSGDRLREWMDIDRGCFYDERRIAIIPMGYCYPGRGRSGDLPPRGECSELWLDRLLQHLPRIQLTLLVGQYAQRHYLGTRRKSTLTETVRAWREYQPQYLPMPHPSGRNNAWMGRNPWFGTEVLPALRRCCRRMGVGSKGA